MNGEECWNGDWKTGFCFGKADLPGLRSPLGAFLPRNALLFFSYISFSDSQPISLSYRTQHCLFYFEKSELNSFLWTIRKDLPSHFFGTIHVPYTRLWGAIFDNSRAAFQESSIVYLHIIPALTSCQRLLQGGDLRDAFSKNISCYFRGPWSMSRSRFMISLSVHISG